MKHNNVKQSVVALGVMAAIVVAGSTGLAQGEKSKKKEVIYASAEQATFKEEMPGVSMAVLWGDPDKGKHGTFTKFIPGHDAGMHTHTNDVWVVVLKGAYLYKDETGEKRVGPGEFIRIPGASTGAAVTRPTARSFTKKAQVNSTSWLQSKSERE
jgi:mannose-6-phosphate isomerase-like protein (cupin superfamily)